MGRILATLKLAFLVSTIKIIICNIITQYPTKEQRNQLIEEAHSSAIGGHKGVTKTYTPRPRLTYASITPWLRSPASIVTSLVISRMCALARILFYVISVRIRVFMRTLESNIVL